MLTISLQSLPDIRSNRDTGNQRWDPRGLLSLPPLRRAPTDASSQRGREESWPYCRFTYLPRRPGREEGRTKRLQGVVPRWLHGCCTHSPEACPGPSYIFYALPHANRGIFRVGDSGFEPLTSSASRRRSGFTAQSGECRHVSQNGVFKTNRALFAFGGRTRRYLPTLADIWCTGVPNGVAEAYGNAP